MSVPAISKSSMAEYISCISISLFRNRDVRNNPLSLSLPCCREASLSLTSSVAETKNVLHSKDERQWFLSTPLPAVRNVSLSLLFPLSGLAKFYWHFLSILIGYSHSFPLPVPYYYYTVSQKNCAKLFLSELCQMSTNYYNFGQRDGKEAKIMRGVLIFHFT